MIAALAAFLLSLAASCSRERPVSLAPRVDVEEEAAPAAALPVSVRRSLPAGAVSVRIVPDAPVRGTPLRLLAAGIDLSKGRVEWLVGEETVPEQRSETLGTAALAKGDVVQARVRLGEQVFASNRVTLRNAPPEIASVTLVPDPFRPGVAPAVEAAGSDADGDDVALEFSWEKNGKPAGTGAAMDGALARGDTFSVRITPFDGEARGRSLTLRREFRNYLPSIEGAREAKLTGDVYSCRIAAVDGDGDPLTYVLKEAPEGMSMDPASGRIRWQVPPGAVARVPVTVSVTDGHGGEASYSMFLSFREEPPAPPKR